MKVLIYNPRIALYFKSLKVWNPKPEEAASFASLDHALKMAVSLNSSELELELHIKPGQPPVRVPIRDYIEPTEPLEQTIVEDEEMWKPRKFSAGG